jgi:hypothetical protein
MAVKPKATKTGSKKKTGRILPFADKLVLNQWIMSLLGIDTFADHQDGQRRVRPMQLLAKQLRDCKEGLDSDNLHYFYQQLKTHWQPAATLSLDALLAYEQNIVAHTLWLNEGRDGRSSGSITNGCRCCLRKSTCTSIFQTASNCWNN